MDRSKEGCISPENLNEGRISNRNLVEGAQKTVKPVSPRTIGARQLQMTRAYTFNCAPHRQPAAPRICYGLKALHLGSPI